MANLLDALKHALGIISPSRAFADLQWDHITFDGSPWPPPTPAPWYAARGPRDAYESPELRSAARHVRRLIRRHWYICDRLAKLDAALAEALDEWEYASAYKGEHLAKKHGDAVRIAELRTLLAPRDKST